MLIFIVLLLYAVLSASTKKIKKCEFYCRDFMIFFLWDLQFVTLVLFLGSTFRAYRISSYEREENVSSLLHNMQWIQLMPIILTIILMSTLIKLILPMQVMLLLILLCQYLILNTDWCKKNSADYFLKYQLML